MPYYTLIPSRLAVIDEFAPEPDDGELPAYTHPRSITVQDVVADLWEHNDEIRHLLDGRISLVGVSPLGDVTSARVDGEGSEFIASDGWVVESILSLDLLFGPQAAGIRNVVSASLGINQEADYGEIVEDIRDLDEEIDNLVESAQDALNRADVDGDWWAEQVECTCGYERIALAARDLVAESTDWNLRAFHQLMRPWTEVIGWPSVICA